MLERRPASCGLRRSAHRAERMHHPPRSAVRIRLQSEFFAHLDSPVVTMAGEGLDELLGDLPGDARRALSHPYRRRILRILLAGGPMSSAQIASHPSAPCNAPCLARHVSLLDESSLLVDEGVTEERGTAQHFFSVGSLPASIHEILAETQELDRDTGLWLTPEERVALEAHIPEISGICAAVHFMLGGPIPPLTFDDGIYLVMALAGPTRPDGTVAVDMPAPELRSMLARVWEDLATRPEVEESRAHQIECACARMLGTKDLPQGHGR